MSLTFDEFNENLARLAHEMAEEIDGDLAIEVESGALRFVDDNFTNQGWEGVPWKESTGTILVKGGDLRSGFRGERSPGTIRIYNEVIYAKAHNEGFSGTVEIPKHTRMQKAGKKGVFKAGKMIDVKAHSRKMNLPQRQFAPYEGHESNTLNTTIEGIIDEKVTELLNQLKEKRL